MEDLKVRIEAMRREVHSLMTEAKGNEQKALAMIHVACNNAIQLLESAKPAEEKKE